MPTTAPAAPSSTTQAAPSQSPPPKSTPKQSGPDGLVESQPEGSPYSDSIAELEEFDTPATERKPKQQPKPASEPKKPEEAKEPEKAEDATDKTEQPKPEEPKPQKAAELRAAYEKSKETIKQKDAELGKIKADLEALKANASVRDESKLLAEKLEASEKRRQELEKEIEFTNYQKSEDYQTKIEQPLIKAWSKAEKDLKELTIEDEDGTSRAATVNDLLALVQMPLKEAWQRSKTLFGDAASEIMAHRRVVGDLMDQQQETLKNAQANSETRLKEQSVQRLQQREKLTKLWQDENKTWADKFPRWFQPEDGDEKGNALLAKGYDLADRAFSSNGNVPPEEKVKMHAEIRNKAAAFPRLALRLKEARERIKELEKTVGEYEASAPPAGEGGKPRDTKPTVNDLDDAMAELSRFK